jgi:hypothetical protein
MYDRFAARAIGKSPKRPFIAQVTPFFNRIGDSKSLRPAKKGLFFSACYPSTAALLIITAILLLNCRGRNRSYPVSEKPLAVAVAANVLYAMQDIEAAFEKKEGIPIDLVSASSGKLSTQIAQGAPITSLFLPT